MSMFKYIVYGLYFGAGFLLLMYLGEIINPGMLADTAFTDIGIMSVFLLLIFDSLFSLGSAEE